MQVKGRVTALNFVDLAVLIHRLLLLLLVLRPKAVQDSLGLLTGGLRTLGLLQAGPTKFDRLLRVVIHGVMDLLHHR